MGDGNGFTTNLTGALTMAGQRKTAEILGLQSQWHFVCPAVEALSDDVAPLHYMKCFLLL